MGIDKNVVILIPLSISVRYLICSLIDSHWVLVHFVLRVTAVAKQQERNDSHAD